MNAGIPLCPCPHCGEFDTAAEVMKPIDEKTTNYQLVCDSCGWELTDDEIRAALEEAPKHMDIPGR